MITVRFLRDSNHNISTMTMSGHAGYDVSGKDIVCAGASTLLYTYANSLISLVGIEANSCLNVEENSKNGNVSATINVPLDKLVEEDKLKVANAISESIRIGFITLQSSANFGSNRYIEIIEEN